MATYFQIIETTADGHYNAILKRIAANNAAIANGQTGEFGRPIMVKELKADIALYYLVDFSQDRLTEAVNLGVQHAREWCAANGIPFRKGAEYPVTVDTVPTKLWFTEEMKGFWAEGEMDFVAGDQNGRTSGNNLMFHLTRTIDGAHDFVVRPKHDTINVVGYVKSGVFGQCPVEKGTFNLFTDDADPSIKYMLYRLFFTDAQGRQLTLSGKKIVKDAPHSDVWRATTTLYTRILKGHVAAAQEEAAATNPATLAALTVGSGIIVIQMLDFLKQLTTFQVEAPSITERVTALTEFGRLFFGKLWDVYAREILTSGPI